MLDDQNRIEILMRRDRRHDPRLPMVLSEVEIVDWIWDDTSHLCIIVGRVTLAQKMTPTPPSHPNMNPGQLGRLANSHLFSLAIGRENNTVSVGRHRYEFNMHVAIRQ